mmetsp:Transcript_22156/g.55557  ORF Transcript_22156/g.55557 Transcript_22156/m.55557 type:complete len:219 (-) Transcript_22156:1404-2060(-)
MTRSSESGRLTSFLTSDPLSSWIVISPSPHVLNSPNRPSTMASSSSGLPKGPTSSIMAPLTATSTLISCCLSASRIAASSAALSASSCSRSRRRSARSASAAFLLASSSSLFLCSRSLCTASSSRLLPSRSLSLSRLLMSCDGVIASNSCCSPASCTTLVGLLICTLARLPFFLSRSSVFSMPPGSPVQSACTIMTNSSLSISPLPSLSKCLTTRLSV